MTTRWRRIVPSTVQHLFLEKASIDMRAGCLLSCLLIALAHGADSLNPDAGPWVQPTHGEPWPMPNHRHVTDKFYLLRASTFQLNVSNRRGNLVGRLCVCVCIIDDERHIFASSFLDLKVIIIRMSVQIPSKFY